MADRLILLDDGGTSMSLEHMDLLPGTAAFLVWVTQNPIIGPCSGGHPKKEFHPGSLIPREAAEPQAALTEMERPIPARLGDRT